MSEIKHTYKTFRHITTHGHTCTKTCTYKKQVYAMEAF